MEDNKDIIVKKSKIQGKGVFANRNFKKGEIVIKWNTSKKINKSEFAKLPKHKKKYIALINGEYIVNQSPAKFVNHSCNSNTKVKNFCDVAIRNIKNGEEITGNYIKDTPEKEKWACKCGSKDCVEVVKNG